MSTVESLAERLGHRLKATGHLLASAESCTGGWAAQAVTAVAGSSQWFERGFVTYSNASKEELLGVRAETLAEHGAVSEATAREMAAGALARSRASIALAITGVAGPSGGTASKPVGMVCFAWATKDGATRVETRRFLGERREIREQSVVRALAGTLELLESIAVGHTDV